MQSENTAIGTSALFNNITSSNNTAVGDRALFNTGFSTGGSDNTAVGHRAGRDQTSGSGNVYVGSEVFGSPAEANKTRIRNIGITPIVAGATVVIAAAGSGIGDEYLGYSSSSRRYKQDVQPIAESSQALFSLKPVTYRASTNAAPADVKLYGLIAEDVADVDRNLVILNHDGQAEAVRYDSVNAMLLNECAESVMVTDAVRLRRSLLHGQGEIIAGPAAVVGFVGHLSAYIALIGWECPS